MTNAEEIADLESQLTGDMFADMKLKGGNAPLMILSVGLVYHKNKGNQNRKREACLSYP